MKKRSKSILITGGTGSLGKTEYERIIVYSSGKNKEWLTCQQIKKNLKKISLNV